MSNMIGMDVEAVGVLATQFDAQADAVEAVIAALDPEVNNVEIWKGKDAESFRSDWESIHKTNLTQCATALREAGTRARSNADEQTATSGNG